MRITRLQKAHIPVEISSDIVTVEYNHDLDT